MENNWIELRYQSEKRNSEKLIQNGERKKSEISLQEIDKSNSNQRSDLKMWNQTFDKDGRKESFTQIDKLGGAEC